MVIRSGGMYVARSIFAEVRLPTGSKNAFLADLPPGSVEDARGKSVGESVGFEGPEIVPVAQSHRKAGRKALERGTKSPSQ